jgi:hypothetical protein
VFPCEGFNKDLHEREVKFSIWSGQIIESATHDLPGEKFWQWFEFAWQMRAFSSAAHSGKSEVRDVKMIFLCWAFLTAPNRWKSFLLDSDSFLWRS